MKETMRYALYALVIGFMTTALTALAAGQTGNALPTLRGDEAIDKLKETGQYDSLMEAVRDSRKKNGQADEPQTEDAIGQSAKLLASDGAASDQFGWSVSISGDTAIVGVFADDVGANFDQGSAYIFVRSGTTWTQQAQLTANDGAANDFFGWSVSISGDTAIVGAYRDDVGANTNQGSAYVFVRSGTTWTQQVQLTANDGAANDFFGWSVSISGDTAIVGAYADDVGVNGNQGSAYIFIRSGTTWTEQAKLLASDGATSDQFGYSVSISGDTAIVGACFDDVGANTNQGSAYVFVRSGTTWTQQAQLTANDGAANDFFGYSVSISGNTAIVGAYFDDVGANPDQGSAYVFVRSGTTWTQQIQLTAADGVASDQFGYSVAVSGNNIIVGAYFDDVAANPEQGSAYIFRVLSNNWTQEAQKVASDGAAGDNFGWSVAISGDTAVVSAYLESTAPNISNGAVYVFVRSGTTWTEQAKLLASDAATSDNFGQSVAISGDTIVVSANVEDTIPNINNGAAYVFVRSGTAWTEQAKLLASDAGSNDQFGRSVAISGDTIVVGAVFKDTSHADNGAVYVFTRSGTTWTEQAKLFASDRSSSDFFGQSVGISGDTIVVGAYNEDTTPNTDNGAAYIFTRSAGVWTEQAKLLASDAASIDNFGNSVAISGDTIVVGAYLEDTAPNSANGAAYVFTRSAGVWTEQAKLLASDAASSDQFGNSVAISGDTIVVGASTEDTAPNSNNGAAYIFTRNGVTWTQQTKLLASSAANGDQFGYSVGVSGDKIIVGAPYSDASVSIPLALNKSDGLVPQATDQGAAFIFVNNLIPNAAGVSIGGRVLTSSGAGVRNAVVYLIKSNGETIQTRTGTFGYYAFEELEAGETYIISVASKRFTFAPRIVTANDNLTEVDFTALE